ncbi:hypothetical protein V1477_021180 [Vespula maculifrons]|uniref:Uncharacterized protein n=1 Tax=Vespula maculifrons TaxID=7453 RepID=A0ABD2AGE2_VESMC
MKHSKTASSAFVYKDKGDSSKGNDLSYLQEALKKFRKTLTILDSTIPPTDNIYNLGPIELLQKPENVKARLVTSPTDQFAYHIIFIKTKRNRKKYLSLLESDQ